MSDICLIYNNIKINQNNAGVNVIISDKVIINLKKYGDREKDKKNKTDNRCQKSIKLWRAQILNENKTMYWCERGYEKEDLFFARLEVIDRTDSLQEQIGPEELRKLAKAAEEIPIELKDLEFLMCTKDGSPISEDSNDINFVRIHSALSQNISFLEELCAVESFF